MFERIESVALDVAHAMEFLHKHNIIFQDLKPDNIGFDMGTDQVKLFDFGMARKVDPYTGKSIGRASTSSKPICAGTPRYMAPEIFLGEGGNKKSDVFSFGILLYVLCTLNSSFGPVQDLSQYRDFVCFGGRPNLDDIPDSSTRRLVGECLSPSPRQRPSFVEIANFRLPEILHNACKSRPSLFDMSTRTATTVTTSSSTIST